MDLSHRLQLREYSSWAVIIGFILLSALIVWPFVGAIISAFILAYFVRPLFLKIKPRFGNSLAGVFCVLLTLVLIIVPISFISLVVLDQASGVTSSQGVSNIVDVFVAQPFLKNLNIDAIALKAWINLTITDAINSTLQSIPLFGLNLIITLNCMFYLLFSWDELVSHLKKYLPFEDKHKEKLVAKLGYATGAIVHSAVLISLLEAAIAFIGFSLLGIPSSLLLSVLIFIVAFAPGIGPDLIWIPLALYYFAISQYITMWGVIAIGLILMIGIEFFFYNRFVGSKSRIHPFIMMIGVLGGIYVFGIFGFIIGPLVLVNSIKIIELSMWSDIIG